MMTIVLSVSLVVMTILFIISYFRYAKEAEALSKSVSFLSNQVRVTAAAVHHGTVGGQIKSQADAIRVSEMMLEQVLASAEAGSDPQRPA